MPSGGIRRTATMLRPFNVLFFVLLGLLSQLTAAANILTTSGFSTCQADSTISVSKMDISYVNDNKTVTFNVAGTSSKIQNVTAMINVTAYGISVYANSFNPCDSSTYVAQLCPVPSGTFSATGIQEIPTSYADQIPSIAFSIPDIAAQATLQLKSLDTGDDVACITSSVTNGKTVAVAAVSYVAAAIAGAALVMTGVSALSAAAGGASTGGAGTVSPSFSDVIMTMQGFAMNGMFSVNYPPVYRAFAKNFAFSTGLVPWTSMQTTIDNFRNATGGNLTANSVATLEESTLVYSDTSSTLSRRGVELFFRDLTTSASDNTTSETTNSTTASVERTVSGIQAYVEQLTVPQTNTFMTVLLITAILIAAIAVGILLFKVILETWALFGSFPKSLVGFRKHYWGTMARTITQLIFLLYGVWVLYCLFQFTNGDSWAAKILAAVTLAIFTGVLVFFSFMIFKKARELKKIDGDASALYDDKKNWLKFKIFIDSYKKSAWWLFIPAIIYMFAKGVVLAVMDGKGLSQTVGQLIIECLMLSLLVWNRPYERKSGNVINMFIQIVRVISVVCILVFVEELGIAQTTQTVTGVALIAVQSVLTGVLAILIVVNAFISCCKTNPHRQRRKELEKLNRDVDNLTPLDARNSLLLNRNYENDPKNPLIRSESEDSFTKSSANPYAGATALRPYTPQSQPRQPQQPSRMDDRQNLVAGAAPLGGRDLSPPPSRGPPALYGEYQQQGQYPNNGPYQQRSPPRQPTVPNVW